MFDFSNDDLRKIFDQKFWNFFRGYPLFGPSKCGVSKNDHPSTAYDPTFLLQNPFPHKKCGCLQKTRAQSVKIWPRNKGLKWKKKYFLIFSTCKRKNAINQRVFKIFPNLFSTSKKFYFLGTLLDSKGCVGIFNNFAEFEVSLSQKL